MSYNYEVFDLAREQPPFEAFRNMLHVGQPAPSFSLEDLATGEQVHMRSLWRREVAILEFGSLT